MAAKYSKRMVTSLAVTVVFLLFLLLLLWAAMKKATTAFYIVAVVDLTALLSIFLWISARHAAEDLGALDAGRANLVAFASVVAFVTLIILLCVRVLGPRMAFYLAGAATGAVIVSLLSWVVVSWVVAEQRKRRTARGGEAWEEEVRLEYNFLRRFAGLPVEFTYEELAAATENFRSLVGKGGCSSVFKGVLDDGTAAAVKRVEREARLDREFRSEVAAIASVQHVNLVRLLGYCLAPGGRRFLVYEFFPNGSLDAWIFPTTKVHNGGGGAAGGGGGGCLSWALRYQVAVDVARALAYLHHDCWSRILHLDIKPENILLDGGFRACVADFGMARLVGKEESSVYTTLRGTRGYFAPEWFSDGGISDKSDVYSFGLVLLEMIGGRRNVSPPPQLYGAAAAGAANSIQQLKPLFFPRLVDEKMREGKKLTEVVVDERLLGEVDEGEVTVLARVALWCIQEKPDRRPSMAAVVDMLRGYVAVEMPPASPMFMADLLETDVDLQYSGGIPPLFVSRRTATSSTPDDIRLLASPGSSSSMSTSITSYYRS